MVSTVQAVKKVDYTDREGIKRRVLIPDGVTDYSEGIPISLSLDSLYPHCPVEYVKTLTDELWARGLVEPCDFRRAGANELVRAALLAVAKKDVLDIVNFANKECKP